MSTVNKIRNLSSMFLMLIFLAGATLTGCSSTDEAAQEDTSGGGDCSHCADGDWNCMDACTGAGG